MIENFFHWRTDAKNPVDWQTFSQEVLFGVLRICDIYITGMVNDTTINFFRGSIIERTVAGF
jgi:hypothetical protein